jgi:hypothetical protein
MTLSVAFLYVFDWSGIHTLAFLYADPGSGALAWQLLVASFVGGLFYMRLFIRRIVAMMSGGRKGEQRDRKVAIDHAVSITPNRKKIEDRR